MVLCPWIVHQVLDGVIRSYAWNHRCDGQTMRVVLRARSYDESRDLNHEAVFYKRGAEYPLFSYHLHDQNPDLLRFKIARYSVTPGEMPEGVAPVMDEIRCNMTARTFTGTCPKSEVKQCLHGSFVPGTSFSLTYNPDNMPVTTAHELRVITRGWHSDPEAPALTIKSADVTGKLGDVVLKTAIPDPGRCRNLKVCIPHGKLDASVLVPLGLVHQQQAAYAIKCTAPRY